MRLEVKVNDIMKDMVDMCDLTLLIDVVNWKHLKLHFTKINQHM